MDKFSYLKFVAKDLVDGSFYNGVETDGKTSVSIRKGSVGKISEELAGRLLKDFPNHFESATEGEFKKQNEPPSTSQKNGKTPEDMEKEIKQEKGKK